MLLVQRFETQVATGLSEAEANRRLQEYGAILTVFTVPFLGLPLPFSPIQLLWVNIIMDGPPAMALGMDPRPARRNEQAAAPRR